MNSKKILCVDLRKLLHDRTVAHPTRINSATMSCERTLVLACGGVPWWSAGKANEGSIEFVFEGISSGCLDLEDFDPADDEALEVFTVTETDKTDWLSPIGSALYCSDPLPDPFKLFVLMQDFTKSRTRLLDAFDFLNTGNTESARGFTEIVASTSYLLCRGPDALCDLVVTELDSQRVRYSRQPERFYPPKPLLVAIGGSEFFCETATARFEV